MLTEKVFPKKIWGPCAWHLLHAFSIGNNKEIKKEDPKKEKEEPECIMCSS